MSLRSKMLLIFGVALGALLLGLYGAASYVIGGTFARLETERVARSQRRTREVLRADIRALDNLLADWAPWDETYRYVRGERREQYTSANLQPGSLVDLDIDLMVILDADGRTVFSSRLDPSQRSHGPLPPELEPLLRPGSSLLARPLAGEAVTGGLLRSGDEILEIVAQPVLPTDRRPPAAGAMVLGRLLDAARVGALGRSAGNDLSLHLLDDAGAPPDLRAALPDLLVQPDGAGVQPLGDDATAAYLRVDDLHGRPCAVFRFTFPRTLHRAGQETLRYLLWAIVLTCLVYAGATALLLRSQVLARLSRLSAKMHALAAGQSFGERVRVDGADELSTLARSINVLLAAADQSRGALRRSKEAAEAALRSKSELVTGLSHDLRTPMSGVMGALDLLGASPVDAEQRTCVEIARASALRVLDLADDLVDLARVEAGRLVLEPQEFDLWAELEEVIGTVSTLRTHPDVALVLRYRPDAPRWLRADRTRLRRVVTNLVANAIKFTCEGHVLLGVDVEPTGPLLRLRVEDTGVGISASELSVVFEPFTQADGAARGEFGGSGLGLAISKQLVEHMNGSLRVDSEQGRGSLFTVELPVQLAPAREARAAGRCCSDRRLLLVEPHALSRETLEEVLVHAGACCTATESWATGLHLLEEATGTDEGFDAVVASARSAPLASLIEAASRPNQEGVDWILLVPMERTAELRTLRRPSRCAVITLPLQPSRLLAALATGPQLDAAAEPAKFPGEGPSGAPPELVTGAPDAPGDLRVLIVDDDSATRLVLSSLVRKLGCVATSAEGGAAAARRFEEQPADLVIVDLHMRPLTGGETLALLRSSPAQQAAKAVFVASSADTEARVAARATELGFDGALAKPVAPAALQELLQTVRRARGPLVAPPLAPEADGAPADPGDHWDSQPVLDPTQALRNAGDDPQLLRGLFRVLLDTGPPDAEALLGALRRGDSVGVEEHGHRLKGALAQLGGLRSHALLLEVERHNRAAEGPPPGHLADTVERRLDELWHALRQWLATGRAAAGGDDGG